VVAGGGDAAAADEEDDEDDMVHVGDFAAVQQYRYGYDK